VQYSAPELRKIEEEDGRIIKRKVRKKCLL
jgi:hypothetical protein